MNAQELQQDIERIERKIASLDREYGTGVRPSWVSCDRAILEKALTGAKRMLEEVTNA